MSGFSSPPSVFRGASVSMSSTQSIPDATNTIVAWNGTEDYDTDAIHDTVTNNSRLTVPAGVTKVRMTFAYDWASGAGTRAAYITKNGSNIRRELKQSAFEASGVLSSGPVDCVGGDYFETVVWQGSSGGALNLAGGSLCRFIMEVIK